MLDTQVVEILDTFGVSRETQAGIDLFCQVSPPQDAAEAHSDNRPVTVAITVGQTTLIRALLRSQAQQIATEAGKAKVYAEMLGTDDPASFLEGPPLDQFFQSILALEDALASAYYGATVEVESPDTLPDDWQ